LDFAFFDHDHDVFDAPELLKTPAAIVGVMRSVV
jgi:hypothetical protein